MGSFARFISLIIICCAVAFIGGYVVGAVLFATFDISEWDPVTRKSLIIGMAVGALILAVIGLFMVDFDDSDGVPYD